MPTVMAAEGPILDRVLDATCRTVRIGLDRDACGKFHRARLKTAWGAGHQRAFAVVDGDNILAAVERYDLPGVLDGAAVRVCAVGSLWTGPLQPDGVHARTLIDAVLADAERHGAEMALLFPSANIADDVGRAFDAVPMTDLRLSVTESSRHGAPMTMVRGGEERDFAAMVAMGRVRADQLRFHLDRDTDFIQYVITTRRLLAGLGSAHARQLHFFIAEEGITAAAYVIKGMRRPRCLRCTGRRAPASVDRARARGAASNHPCLAASGVSAPSGRCGIYHTFDRTIRVRLLGSRATASPLSAADVLFWHNDLL